MIEERSTIVNSLPEPYLESNADVKVFHGKWVNVYFQ